jgi:hypothetical protein
VIKDYVCETCKLRSLSLQSLKSLKDHGFLNMSENNKDDFEIVEVDINGF